MLYKAIAITGIWIGVGLSAQAGDVVGFVALMGMVATLAVMLNNCYGPQ